MIIIHNNHNDNDDEGTIDQTWRNDQQKSGRNKEKEEKWEIWKNFQGKHKKVIFRKTNHIKIFN